MAIVSAGGAGTNYLRTSFALPTASTFNLNLPFCVGMWVNPSNTSNESFWSLRIATGGFGFTASKTTVWSFYRNGNTMSTGAVSAGKWYYVIVRAISQTNSRIDILNPDGSTTHATDATNIGASVFHQDTFDVMAVATVNGLTGSVSRYWFALGGDVNPNGGALDDAMLKKMAYHGPFVNSYLASFVKVFRSYKIGGSQFHPRLDWATPKGSAGTLGAGTTSTAYEWVGETMVGSITDGIDPPGVGATVFPPKKWTPYRYQQLPIFPSVGSGTLSLPTLKQNIASQGLTFLLINASTGGPLLGATVSVLVTDDNGTQSVGGGPVTELGNGQYNYTPTQAETNAADVGFLFTANNAIQVNRDIHTWPVDVNSLRKVGVGAIHASTLGAQGEGQAPQSVCWGTVGNGSTTTSIAVASIINPSSTTATGQFIGRTLIFLGNTTTAALQSAAAGITASTTGAAPTLTVTGLTTPPVIGDAFVIV